MENISSEQELKQLLEEGKITEEQYRQLLDAMCKHGKRLSSSSDSSINSQIQSKNGFPFRNVPGQIWVIVVLLAWEGISNLFMIPDCPWAVTWLLAKVLFVVGLIRAWKWVFVVFQIIAGIHVLYFAAAGGWLVSFLNLILIILAFSALRYFFPVRREISFQEKSGA